MLKIKKADKLVDNPVDNPVYNPVDKKVGNLLKTRRLYSLHVKFLKVH